MGRFTDRLKSFTTWHKGIIALGVLVALIAFPRSLMWLSIIIIVSIPFLFVLIIASRGFRNRLTRSRFVSKLPGISERYNAIITALVASSYLFLLAVAVDSAGSVLLPKHKPGEFMGNIAGIERKKIGEKGTVTTRKTTDTTRKTTTSEQITVNPQAPGGEAPEIVKPSSTAEQAEKTVKKPFKKGPTTTIEKPTPIKPKRTTKRTTKTTSKPTTTAKKLTVTTNKQTTTTKKPITTEKPVTTAKPPTTINQPRYTEPPYTEPPTTVPPIVPPVEEPPTTLWGRHPVSDWSYDKVQEKHKRPDVRQIPWE